MRPALPGAPTAELARRFDLLTLTRKAKDYARFLYARTSARRALPRLRAATALVARAERALRARRARGSARSPSCSHAGLRVSDAGDDPRGGPRHTAAPALRLRPKPVLPVRGHPAHRLPARVARPSGVSDAVVNVHHLAPPPDARRNPETWAPPRLDAVVLRRARAARHRRRHPSATAAFLRESDPSLVLAGDMIQDLDLSALVATNTVHAATQPLWCCARIRAKPIASVRSASIARASCAA